MSLTSYSTVVEGKLAPSCSRPGNWVSQSHFTEGDHESRSLPALRLVSPRLFLTKRSPILSNPLTGKTGTHTK